VRDDGALYACNTDYAAALDAVCDGLGVGRDELAGMRIAVVGAGGAARAVVAGFAQHGATVVIYNRTFDKARREVIQSNELTEEQKSILTQLFSSLDRFASSDIPTQSDSADGESPDFAGWRPVQVDVSEIAIANADHPRTSYEVSFPQGIVWGLMGCVMTFGVSMVMERSGGTLLRLVVAPITRRQILLGKALACFLACLLVEALILILGVVILRKVQVGSPALLAMAMVASAVGFTGIMMIIAGFSKSEAGASGIARGVMIMLAMIGGGSVPMFLLPPLVQKLAGISPFTWTTRAIEGAIWRGYSLQEMLLPLGVLLGIGVLGYIIGANAIKRSAVT